MKRISLTNWLLGLCLLMASVAGAGGAILAAWGVGVFARTAPEVVASGRNNYAAAEAYWLSPS